MAAINHNMQSDVKINWNICVEKKRRLKNLLTDVRANIFNIKFNDFVLTLNSI